MAKQRRVIFIELASALRKQVLTLDSRADRLMGISLFSVRILTTNPRLIQHKITRLAPKSIQPNVITPNRAEARARGKPAQRAIPPEFPPAPIAPQMPSESHHCLHGSFFLSESKRAPDRPYRFGTGHPRDNSAALLLHHAPAAPLCKLLHRRVEPLHSFTVALFHRPPRQQPQPERPQIALLVCARPLPAQRLRTVVRNIGFLTR